MEKTKREQLQDINRECLVISANIYDMNKELAAMNETANKLIKQTTEALNSNETDEA